MIRTWIYVDEPGKGKMVEKMIKYVPLAFKLFDTILINAIDNKQRDDKTSKIFVSIDEKENDITVYNDGAGIPQDLIHCGADKIHQPTILFGHLPATFTYDKTKDEMDIDLQYGGFGGKICNIMSNYFTIDTVTNKTRYEQNWKKNMSEAGKPKITTKKAADYTEISFSPDWKRLGMAGWSDDYVGFFKRRAYDVSSIV